VLVGGTSVEKSAEMYCISTNTWRQLAEMPASRIFSQAKLLVSEDDPYHQYIGILGGREGGSANLDTSLAYDIKNDSYSSLPWQLPCRGADRGAVAITDDGTIIIVDPLTQQLQSQCWELRAPASNFITRVVASQWRKVDAIPVDCGLIASFAPA
jgi:hypothetical protein